MYSMQKEISWLLKEKYPEINLSDLNGASHGKLTQQFNKDIERLKAGEPLDYVIGFTEFLGCKIDLSKNPLIPRPETEYWVGAAVESLKLKVKSKGIKILDIFSGSGCIGISIMRHIKKSKVTFAEKDKKFLKQIKINCLLNKIAQKRYNIIQSDIFSNVKEKYDFIFANPPYIPKSRINKIQKSVLKYEPKMALFGGSDGLFYIKKFLKGAIKYLNINGKIYMEFDSIQKRQIEKLIRKYGYGKCEFFKDQYNKYRWVIIEA